MHNLVTLFGLRVRQLRERAGFSQEGFAHDTGLGRSHYGRIERGEGNVSLETVETIAEGLGVPALELFRFSRLPKEKP